MMAVAVLVLLAALVVVVYLMWPSRRCPSELHEGKDGFTLEPTGQVFKDMNDFQQWWHSSGHSAKCPIPILTGYGHHKKERERGEGGWPNEQTFARTPINKVDDYEFSRIFGFERDGRMEVPRQDYNRLLNKRTFDWADKPYSSNERRAKYSGLHEGFTASGDFGSVTPEQEKEHEVKEIVAKEYAKDKDYEPVITRIGPNNWEVNELIPKRRAEHYPEPTSDRVVNTADDAVDIAFKYKENSVSRSAIDPYFPPDDGMLPWQSDRYAKDAWAGPVPNMERMFGPTFDRENWIVKGPHPLMAPETAN